jgi:DNA-binding transcriptional MerR regulator
VLTVAETIDSYFTTAEVAERCRTSPETVRYWRHRGIGPRSFKVGRRVLYAAADVAEWLSKLRAEQAGGDAA